MGFGRACLKQCGDEPNIYETSNSFLRRVYIKMLFGHFPINNITYENGLTMGFDRSYIK